MFATFINAAHAQYDPIRLCSYFSVSSDGKFLLHGQCGTQAVQFCAGLVAGVAFPERILLM